MSKATAANIAKILNWRRTITRKNFKAKKGYQRDYMTIGSKISQKDLDTLCLAVNSALQTINSKLRVSNSMGELIPARVKE